MKCFMFFKLCLVCFTAFALFCAFKISAMKEKSDLFVIEEVRYERQDFNALRLRLVRADRKRKIREMTVEKIEVLLEDVRNKRLEKNKYKKKSKK